MITTLKDDGLSQKAKELSEMLAAGGKPIETNADGARQLIIYGAPGTGKSHKIDKYTNESNSIRPC